MHRRAWLVNFKWPRQRLPARTTDVIQSGGPARTCRSVRAGNLELRFRKLYFKLIFLLKYLLPAAVLKYVSRFIASWRVENIS